MGRISGRYTDLPWGDAYDEMIVQFREETNNFKGEDLLHQIHMQAIEAHWVNVRFYGSLRNYLTAVIWLQIGALCALGYLIYRLGA